MCMVLTRSGTRAISHSEWQKRTHQSIETGADTDGSSNYGHLEQAKKALQKLIGTTVHGLLKRLLRIETRGRGQLARLKRPSGRSASMFDIRGSQISMTRTKARIQRASINISNALCSLSVPSSSSRLIPLMLDSHQRSRRLRVKVIFLDQQSFSLYVAAATDAELWKVQ